MSVSACLVVSELRTLVPPVLVEHSIEGNGSLAGLTIANDELTLTTADGDHSINRLESGLHGFLDRLAGQDAWCFKLRAATLLGGDWALAVNGVTESVNDTSKKSLANWYVNNLACALDGLSLLDQTVRTEEHNTDLASFQVHAHALDAGGEPGQVLVAVGE